MSPTRAAPVAPSGPPWSPAGDDRPRPVREPAPAWIAWLVVAAVLVVTAFVGAYLVVRDPGDTTATDPTPVDASPSTEPTEVPTEDPSTEPTEDPTEEPSPEPPAGDQVDLTASTTVAVPGAAPSNNDVTGELVTFVGANMLDGNPATSWRVAGDATGSTITFTFPEPVTVTEVGLINGYAKTSVDSAGREFDWYHGNRRVQSVEWVVGGQTFPQGFADTTVLQNMAIDPVETSTIELRITGATPPGAGSTGRDYTAISDVRFLGIQ